MNFQKILYDEKILINFIRFGPMVLVLVISFFITYIFINNIEQNAQNEKETIKKNYIEFNKKKVQNYVDQTVQFIITEQKFAEKNLKTKIKEQIYQAYEIANAIYQNNIQKIDYSKEKTLKEIKIALNTIRFSDRLGYLFVFELDGKNILNAEFPEIEGKNLWNYQDAKGTYLLQEMKKILTKKDETFYDWYWKKSKDDAKQYKKIGFFKKFEPYNLFIGTGEYFEEFEKRIKKDVLEKLNSFYNNQTEYVFIHDMKGTALVHTNKELVGVNRINEKNSEGEYLVQKVLNFAQINKAGFLKYGSITVLNDTLKHNGKVSYIKLFDNWQWILGSGFYLDELSQQLQKRERIISFSKNQTIKKVIVYSFIITILILLCSFYVSKIFMNIFNEYRAKLQSQMEEGIEKEKLLAQQSKLAAMGEMIGNIAHQWRQPLNNLSILNITLYTRYNKNKLDDDFIFYFNEKSSILIQKMSTTIDDFRNFFKPNKIVELFPVMDAIDEAISVIEDSYQANNIQLKKITQNSIKINSYKNELVQVLLNIFNNARDAFKENKIQDACVEVFIDEGIDTITICIQDNAGGIEKDILCKVFDPYFTTKFESDGTGLGLYMSKVIIENSMKGKLTLENNNGGILCKISLEKGKNE